MSYKTMFFNGAGLLPSQNLVVVVNYAVALCIPLAIALNAMVYKTNVLGPYVKAVRLACLCPHLVVVLPHFPYAMLMSLWVLKKDVVLLRVLHPQLMEILTCLQPVVVLRIHLVLHHLQYLAHLHQIVVHPCQRLAYPIHAFGMLAIHRPLIHVVFNFIQFRKNMVGRENCINY